LDELKDKIQGALVDRVVEDFIDITTPLKQFTDAVLAPEGMVAVEICCLERFCCLTVFMHRRNSQSRREL
jgi:hypothetical protein